jgi:hypothetical protein
MEQNRPSEAEVSSISQEIPRILWDPMVHFRVHKSPTLAPALGQINPVYALRSYFFKICFNINFTSTPTKGGNLWKLDTVELHCIGYIRWKLCSVRTVLTSSAMLVKKKHK